MFDHLHRHGITTMIGKIENRHVTQQITSNIRQIDMRFHQLRAFGGPTFV